MKFCFYCGEWFPDEEKRCPKCGAAELPEHPRTLSLSSPRGGKKHRKFEPVKLRAQPAQNASVAPASAEESEAEPAPERAEAPRKRPQNGKPEHGKTAMLKLKDIKKDYKIASGSVHALKGVTLEFRKSEFVCILGQSGCGKTTLLNIIGGLDRYTTGDLVIQGTSTKEYRDRDWDVYRNHRIGFIFQTYNLIPHQTVLENVELALTIAGVGKSERVRRAKQALTRVGLGGEFNKRPNQLSGGQMQRVAIARALVNDPDILLADEPTGALDSATSVQIMELIKEIAAERLVIMVTHNGELAEQYASRIVRLKDGLVESDSNPYIGTPERKADKPAKKKLRAKMSFFTSLALSFRNLLTKKGRTIITSVAGSIGIISVCLVLALSSGFNTYIRHTEEDMLSYYPLEVSESALDVSSVMSAMNSTTGRPDLSQIGDKVYVNSFLTGLAQGVAVQNDINEQYLTYLRQGKEKHPDWFSALTYNYGFSQSQYIFTPITVGGTADIPEEEERYYSVEALKDFLVDELMTYAPQYTSLLGFVSFFTDVINKMPGTRDFSDPEYSKYVLSQYDVIAGSFPKNEHEAVLVVGEDNAVIDLTLVQLGFLTEQRFLSLFDAGLEQEEDEEAAVNRVLSMTTTLADESAGEIDEANLISFDRIFEQNYMLYNADELYAENPNYLEYGMGEGGKIVANPNGYKFTYEGRRETYDPAKEAAEGKGVDFKISAILRLKSNFTYGCLTEGLNLTEAAIDGYLEKNSDSKIAQFIRDHTYSAGEGEDAYNVYYTAPCESLAKYYTYSMEFDTPFGIKVPVNFTISDTPLRSVGGISDPNDVLIYAADFDAKDNIIGYLDEWNDRVSTDEADRAGWDEETRLFFEGLDEGNVVKYTDRVGLLMGMVQTMLDVITYVLVAFTAISLVVSSVMIGIITYVSVVERIKEIGVLRSLGARKQDIRNLFNAETFIIGLAAGLIGIAVTYVISAIISAIILSLSGIAGIASLPPLTAFIMVCVSVALTLISGLIPAQAAAKKDPVIALRTE